jgi:N-acetyl-1-D-myo-inositol-2-amino-2-deoxy-alpha-D-glucopyranoside deacetylase
VTVLAERRLLLVHAHPDDESINNGATMARYVAEGAAVTLVTCTLGEEGEIIPPELADLTPDELGKHRISELAQAMRELGVTDHRFLGAAGKYRDSGMIYDDEGNATVPPETRPDAFWRADLLTAANDLIPVIRETRPHVLIAYDEFGGYGHPDHVKAHRVATYATALAAVPAYREDLGAAWDIPKVYWTARSVSSLRDGLRKLQAAPESIAFLRRDPEGPPPRIVTEDRYISAVIDGTEYLHRKQAAMAAHRTQITVEGEYFALSNDIGHTLSAVEEYVLAKGNHAPAADGVEHDLFAGLLP